MGQCGVGVAWGMVVTRTEVRQLWLPTEIEARQPQGKLPQQDPVEKKEDKVDDRMCVDWWACVVYGCYALNAACECQWCAQSGGHLVLAPLS